MKINQLKRSTRGQIVEKMVYDIEVAFVNINASNGVTLAALWNRGNTKRDILSCRRATWIEQHQHCM